MEYELGQARLADLVVALCCSFGTLTEVLIASLDEAIARKMRVLTDQGKSGCFAIRTVRQRLLRANLHVYEFTYPDNVRSCHVVDMVIEIVAAFGG
jgi:hypothetical protein